MKKVQLLIEEIKQEIEKQSFPETPKNLYKPLSYFMTLGGKRMRPVLCLLAEKLFNPGEKNALNAALAIEFFHNFTLIHDDIMDDAPLRRGKPTVHELYDTSSAILSGDGLMIIAYEELFKGKYSHEILELFNRTAIEVCEGQRMDMDFEERSSVQTAEYLEMIRLKTAVLLGASLKIGALIGRAEEKDADLLYDFGEKIGIAFQIQDDLLDCFGNEKIGKRIGGDILARKKTFLMLELLQKAAAKDKFKLEEVYASNNSKTVVSTVLEMYDQYGIKEHTENLRDEFYEQAIISLNRVSLSKEQKQSLYALAEFLIQRDY